MIIGIYVDDVYLISTHDQMHLQLVVDLQKDFICKDLGELQWSLGVRFTQTNLKANLSEVRDKSGSIKMDQESYIH